MQILFNTNGALGPSNLQLCYRRIPEGQHLVSCLGANDLSSFHSWLGRTWGVSTFNFQYLETFQVSSPLFRRILDDELSIYALGRIWEVELPASTLSAYDMVSFQFQGRVLDDELSVSTQAHMRGGVSRRIWRSTLSILILSNFQFPTHFPHLLPRVHLRGRTSSFEVRHILHKVLSALRRGRIWDLWLPALNLVIFFFPLLPWAERISSNQLSFSTFKPLSTSSFSNQGAFHTINFRFPKLQGAHMRGATFIFAMGAFGSWSFHFCPRRKTPIKLSLFD